MSSIANAKAVMGWVSGKDRADAVHKCKGCEHVEPRDCIYPTWWCNKGGFLTGANAICNRHPALQKGGGQ